MTMLCAHLGRRALPRLAHQAPRVHRRYMGTQGYVQRLFQNMRPKVPILKPVVWCVTAIGTIYFGLAAFEVRREIKNYTKYGFNSKPDSYDALFAASYSRKHQQSHRQAVGVSPFDLWSNLSETQKVILANIALNTGIYAATSVSGPHTRWYFSHIPITGRNYTMLTSMFGHLSGMHLLFNMYCLYSFGPALARTSTFQDSAPHLAAFYLSAGILASLAAQIEARVPSRRFWRGSGASGAIMAFVGAFGMSFPHAQIGIILVPGSVDAQLALSLMAAFETYGLIFGIPYLRWGHSVHLAGLAIGAAYAHFDGNGKIWDATKRTAFNQMRRVGMV